MMHVRLLTGMHPEAHLNANHRSTETVPVPWTVHMYNPAYKQVTNTVNVSLISPPQVVSGYVDGTPFGHCSAILEWYQLLSRSICIILV